jgi:MFS family permease
MSDDPAGATGSAGASEAAVGGAGAPGHAISFILITTLIDTLGFEKNAPVMPDLIRELIVEGLAEAARYGGSLMFLFAAVQFVAAPIRGNLGDRFGRRPKFLSYGNLPR